MPKDNVSDQHLQSNNDLVSNDYEIVMYQSDYDHPSQMKGLLAESLNTAVLDSMYVCVYVCMYVCMYVCRFTSFITTII